MSSVSVTVKEAKSLKERVVGLIAKPSAHGLLIKTRFGIHTCGLKFPIDVAVLNNQNGVVKLKKSLKPYRVFVWNPSYNKVLELPHGSIEKSGIDLGTKIEISKE